MLESGHKIEIQKGSWCLYERRVLMFDLGQIPRHLINFTYPETVGNFIRY